MLGGSQEMIDLVFEASIADVLDHYIADERLKTRSSARGSSAPGAGPTSPAPRRSSSCTTRATSTARARSGATSRAAWGCAQLRDRRRRRRGRRDARLRRPGRADHARARASTLEDGTELRAATVICNADPNGWRGAARRRRGRRRLPRAARGLEDPQPGGQVQRRASTGCRTGPRRRARPGRPRRRSTRPGRWPRPRPRSSAAPPASPRSGSARSTSRPATTRARRPEGKHLMSVFGQYAPYDIADGDWDAARDGVAKQFIDLISPLRPRLPGLPGRARGARPARHRVADRPHRRQHLPGRGDPGPDVGGPASPRGPRSPGLYMCGAADPPGRQRDRAQRPQRRRRRCSPTRCGNRCSTPLSRDPAEQPAPGRSSRSPWPRNARERILEAACELIARTGSTTSGSPGSAMRAGASTALVHHYFSTREELLERR